MAERKKNTPQTCSYYSQFCLVIYAVFVSNKNLFVTYLFGGLISIYLFFGLIYFGTNLLIHPPCLFATYSNRVWQICTPALHNKLHSSPWNQILECLWDLQRTARYVYGIKGMVRYPAMELETLPEAQRTQGIEFLTWISFRTKISLK